MKAAREYLSHKAFSVRITVDYSSEPTEPKYSGITSSFFLKEKGCSQEFYSAKPFFKNEAEIKILPAKQKTKNSLLANGPCEKY